MSVMDDHAEDQALVRRLRERDEAVLGVILARNGAIMASAIRGIWPGINDADLEEVVADALVDAWFRVDEIDLERGRLATWLLMKARYRTLDRIRAVRRDHNLVARISRIWRGDFIEPEYPSDFDSYLAGLTEFERRLVQLRFVDRRPVLEIAEICRRSPKSIEHHLARLRRDLRTRIAAVDEVGVVRHA